MSAKMQRRRTPELEHDQLRDVAQGFEPKESCGFVQFLQHGYPNPLVRWHYHEEYELHLIVATSGRAFVGDYIGEFRPGHLVLVGPGVPHTWVSSNVSGDGVPVRDMLLNFAHAPLEGMMQSMPETRCLRALLERARHGVEFFGLGARAIEVFEGLREQRGVPRLAGFLQFLWELAHWSEYRLLSAATSPWAMQDIAHANISGILNEIMENSELQFSITDFSRRLGMSDPQFSRLFKKATGNSFVVFVNRLRINKACQLLMETDRYITNICYDVGFNNVANFNRHFLEIKGVTPREFRLQAGARWVQELPGGGGL